MHGVELIAGLFLAVAAISAVAAVVRLPDYVVLVLAGLAIGFIPGLPEIRLEPDVVFLLFLPPLLYRAAFGFAAQDVRPHLRAIGFLAIGLVGATLGGIALIAHFVIGLSWPAAFVLGAAVAPTDPVAATSVIRRLGAPDRLATILEGESLVNDATALASLNIAIGALGAATFSLLEAGGELAWTAVVAVLIGGALGWLASEARKRSGQAQVEITAAIVATYGGFLAADLIGASGILASVVAGLVLGARAPELGTPETRLQADSFWRIVVFLVESALFLLVGLAFAEVVFELTDPALELIGQALLVAVAIGVIRLAWMFTAPRVGRYFDRRESGASPEPDAREKLVLGLAGMRGVVTVAAALSVPLTVDGQEFGERDLILFLAYTSVLLTLVVPALGLGTVLRRLGLGEDDETRERVAAARIELAEAAIERARQIESGEDVPDKVMARARESYEMRIARRREEAGGDADSEAESAEIYRDVRRRLLEAERERLIALRQERSLPGTALRELELDLDVEESRLR
ncbi:Na+/H+ antiporter [Thermoleophilia bacterium SCSIO 60948]|nr:Na+/H+ antiporter [Thermoleophilia bacterium SCSIO 60948]